MDKQLAAYQPKNNSGHKTPGLAIRLMEQAEDKRRMHGFSLTPEIFNLIVLILDLDNPPPEVRVFNWLKGVTSHQPERGGHVLTCESKFFATFLFDFLGADLERALKTDKIKTVFRNENVRYLEVQKVDKATREPLSDRTQALLASVRESRFADGLTKDQARHNLTELEGTRRRDYELFLKNFYGWGFGEQA